MTGIPEMTSQQHQKVSTITVCAVTVNSFDSVSILSLSGPQEYWMNLKL